MNRTIVSKLSNPELLLSLLLIAMTKETTTNISSLISYVSLGEIYQIEVSAGSSDNISPGEFITSGDEDKVEEILSERFGTTPSYSYNTKEPLYTNCDSKGSG
jgi:hypothetical protein